MSTRKADKSGTRGYAHLVEIGAPVNRVWRALTEPSMIRIWQNTAAEVDPRKGGLYRTGVAGQNLREAHIDVFEPNRRLRLIYMNTRDYPRSDSAIVDDFLLDAKPGKTALRLLGSGVPEAQEWDRAYVKIRMSWERLLARMRVMLENPPKPKKPAAPTEPPLPGLDY
ncbi:MAG: SRPBCC domain-containing protein [Proteobacteria bacterium]|nr:SRPBCC domain-containing protein [Pseudomonadota bacterium]